MNGQEKVVSKVVDGQYTDQSIVNVFYEKYDQLYHSVIDHDFGNKIIEVDNLVKEQCCKGNSRGCNGLTSYMSGSKCEILHGGT